MQNRRKFLRNSLLTVTGAGLISKSFPQSLAHQESIENDKKFLYRILGKTGKNWKMLSSMQRNQALGLLR